MKATIKMFEKRFFFTERKTIGSGISLQKLK